MLDKTKRYRGNLVNKILHPAPLGPLCALRKKKSLYLFNSQTHPGNQIIIHRIPLCLIHSLTWKKNLLSEISARKLSRYLCVCVRSVQVHFLSGRCFVGSSVVGSAIVKKTTAIRVNILCMVMFEE